MSFEKIVETLIKEAKERGEFDDLPGEGNPIDLSEYFATLEDVRVAQAMLKNAGMVPMEIELLQEIAALKETLAATRDENEIPNIQKMLKEKQLEFNLLLERNRKK